jgi:hypothetical protein
MERAWSLFGDRRYERLAAISVAHLYNLRQRKGYQRHRQLWTKTRPVTIPIGTRRAPGGSGRPERHLPHQRAGLHHAVRSGGNL